MINTYCLFCCSGKENSVIKMLKNEGFPAIAPTVMHWTGGAAQPKKTARRLMPGYVFFDADTEPAWDRILKDSAVLKLLSYGDGEYALRGTDLEFIDWIKKNNGIIEMSSAVKVGSMIEFVAGPLKDMNGKIIKSTEAGGRYRYRSVRKTELSAKFGAQWSSFAATRIRIPP